MPEIESFPLRHGTLYYTITKPKEDRNSTCATIDAQSTEDTAPHSG
jgi:hypothetical protein